MSCVPPSPPYALRLVRHSAVSAKLDSETVVGNHRRAHHDRGSERPAQRVSIAIARVLSLTQRRSEATSRRSHASCAANCGPCHTEFGLGGHNVGSATLEIATANAARLGATLIQRLDGGGMPPACLGVPGDPSCISVEDLATIQAWLDTGLAP